MGQRDADPRQSEGIGDDTVEKIVEETVEETVERRADIVVDPIEGEIASDRLDASINVSLEVLEEDVAIALQGEGPSAEEQHRAYAFVNYVRGILPRLTHAADAANAYVELADHLGPILGDDQGALDACRTAFRKRPRDLHAARAYRKAALRAGTATEVSTALDAEARRTTAAADRGALHVERALLLARHFNNDKASQYAFKHALDAEPSNVIALMAQEQSLSEEANHVATAAVAQKLAAAVTDPKLRAEHLARAARHLERAGDEQGALALAASARLDAPQSPAVHFVLERLCIAQQALGMFVALRRHQIADEIVDVSSAWFDIGIVAAYRLGDDELAIEAFAKAKAGAGDEAVACLEELAWLHDRREEFFQLSDALADQLPGEDSPWERAALWHRLARVRGEHLEDEDGTIVALEAALAEAPSYYPVLADAGRLFHRSGSHARLIKMHRLEAQAAATEAERGGALRRLGELLVKEESTLDAGITALQDALRASPGNLSAFVALERAFEHKQSWRELAELYAAELEHAKEPARRAHLHSQIGKIATEHLDDQELALKSLRDAVQVDVSGGPPRLLVQLAEQLEGAGELDDLVPVLMRIADATADRSERASIYEHLASVHEKRGRIEDAVLAYKRAVQSAPPSHPVHAAAGRAFLRSERFRDLLDLLEAGLAAAEPKRKAMWLQKIAAVHDRYLGRTDEAVKCLQTALEHAPDSFPVRQALLEIFTRNQCWQDLSDLLAGAKTGSPHRALRRGVVCEAAGDLASALEHYGRAVEGGSKLARLPLLRVAATVKRWDALERHYASSSDVATLLHERCRAAEIAAERLKRSPDAVRYLSEALHLSKTELSPVVSLSLLVSSVPQTHARLLCVMGDLTTDPATKLASLRLAAHACEAGGDVDEIIAAHQRVLALQPSDPVSLVAAEVVLEQKGDRVALAAMLRAAAHDSTLEPQLAADLSAALGSVLEQLGELRAAANALEASRLAGGKDVSRQGLLALHRLYVQLDDDRVSEVLETLAKCPPAGATQAACYRRLAAWWWEREDAPKAASALRSALDIDPCDYRAINALVEIPGVSESEAIDMLMRAFELERDPQLVRILGTTLAARLLLLGRWHTARETIDRVLAIHPDSLPALMLLAETHERRKSWELAAAALESIGIHEEATARVKLEALRRLATIQVLHLQRSEEARATAQRVAELPINDELALRAKLEIDLLLKNDAGAAQTLASLTDEAPASGPTGADDLLRLALLHDESLGDPSRAIATLTRVAEVAGHKVAVPALRVLGERGESWEKVCEALEHALETELDHPWECAIRRRLAQILREHLDRAPDALVQERRILELDPSDGPTAERMAQSVVSHEPEDAVADHRRIVMETPEAIASYRDLRNLFLAADDRDAAFCAEAVLVGLGAANEEEEYFYRQRCAKHAGRVAGSLSPVELALLFPERDGFFVRLFRMVDSLIPRMFPLDMDGYGILDDSPSPSEQALVREATVTASLFSSSNVQVSLVSPRLGPCVELDGDSVRLLMPRDLQDAPPREQRFVCGALLGRSAFGGVATDPRRLSAFTDGQLEQLFVAALAIGNEQREPETVTAVYLDMQHRLSGALGHISLRRFEALGAEAPEDLVCEGQGAALRGGTTRAASHAAVLCTGDPAVAIKSAITYAGMFESADLPERRGSAPIIDKLPIDFRCGLGFAVSETHAKLRHRLFESTEDNG